MGMYEQSEALNQNSQELKVFTRSNLGTTVRQHVVDLDQTADSIASELSDMWDRAVRVRVIARDANRTFIEMRCRIKEYTQIFDKLLPSDKTISESGSVMEENLSSGEDDGISSSDKAYLDKIEKGATEDMVRQNLPSVADLQNTVQSLMKLQKLVETWLLAYNGELVVNSGLQNSITTTYNLEIVLGDKQHIKHLHSAIKQIEGRLYQLVPGGARDLIYPNRKKDRGLAQEVDPLDGLESLGLDAIDMKGPAGHDLKEDRNFVNGMEGLGLWFGDNEIRLEQDDHIEGAFDLLESVEEDRSDVDGVASLR